MVPSIFEGGRPKIAWRFFPPHSLCDQEGKKHEHAKVLSGMGSAKILEIRENDRSGTYRVIYTIEMEDFVFVLHAFQKKSKSGISTPKQELDLLKNL